MQLIRRFDIVNKKLTFIHCPHGLEESPTMLPKEYAVVHQAMGIWCRNYCPHCIMGEDVPSAKYNYMLCKYKEDNGGTNKFPIR